MNARVVDVAIHRLRAMNAEMEDVGQAHWLPEHTLHVYVDPLLRALDWEPSDPEECQPFCPAAGLAGYLLFAVPETLNTTGPHVAVLARLREILSRGCPLGIFSVQSVNSRWGLSPTGLTGKSMTQGGW